VPPLHVAIVEPKNCVGDLIDLLELLDAKKRRAARSSSAARARRRTSR
jgi:hypothetical protein